MIPEPTWFQRQMNLTPQEQEYLRDRISDLQRRVDARVLRTHSIEPASEVLIDEATKMLREGGLRP